MPQLPPVELLQQRLDTWRERYHVAGAALGVMLGDDVSAVASGVINVGTGVEATPDTLFQIGSITKVYTTTLIMQLVDEGRIELDAQARKYLPGLRFADDRATEIVTIRHLLTHTSGVDGDFFDDFGRGDECVERYVAGCATLPSLFDPGAMFSYCNAGFVVLGRIIETMTGTSWDRALRERLLDRIGAHATVTLPEEALRSRTAHGHAVDPSLKISLSPIWHMPRAQGPAGSTPCATVTDLLAFARLHIDAGRGPDGAVVLSPASVDVMQQPQFTLPAQPGPGASQWGLGWMLFDWDGRRVIGHDGGTIGQISSLRVLPQERFAVSMLTNTTPTGGLLGARAVAWLFNELFGVEVPARPKPPEQASPIDLAPYLGTYEKLGARIAVTATNEGLEITYTNIGPLPSPEQPPMPLIPVNEELFLQHERYTNVYQPVVFSSFEGGRPAYLFNGRVARRVS